MEWSRSHMAIVCTGLLVMFLVGSIQPMQCDADIANLTELDMGGTISNSTGLTMPTADVRIRILNSMNEGIHANVSGRFSIVSSNNQTASLAFVYPKYWGNYGSDAISIGLTVSVNETPVNYTVVSWEYLNNTGFQPYSGWFYGTWIESADFVLFSYPLIANDTCFIEVNTRAYALDYGEYAFFTYIVGTASSFHGETHQTVEMHIVEEKEFLEFSFYPEEFLSVSTNSTGTTAIWDLIIDSDSNVTMVQFNSKTNEKVPWRPFPYTVAIVGIGATVLILVTIVVVTILRKRH